MSRLLVSIQSVKWRAKNQAFDRVVTYNQIGDLNIGYPGQYYDKETDTWYNIRRDYDAKAGRYLQSDPLGTVDGPNTYVYVGNNPVNSIDPTGEFAWSVAFAAIDIGYQLYENGGDLSALNYGEMLASSLFGGTLGKGMYRLAKNFSKGKRASRSVEQRTELHENNGNVTKSASNASSWCFVAGTKVQTPDGEKNIEEIKAGDLVYAFDEETGEVVVREVTDTYHNWTKNLVDIVVDGETISSTPSHKFWLPELQKWVAAEEIQEGTKLLQEDGSISVVQSVSTREGLTDVYNLEVDEEHNYFVGKVGYLVHNGPGDQSFADYNRARNAALDWLNQRGFKAESQTIGKFGDNAGKPIGMQTADGKTGFRIEFDKRSGAHINVWSGKEKGPHIKFEGDQKHVNKIVQRFMCK